MGGAATDGAAAVALVALLPFAVPVPESQMREHDEAALLNCAAALQQEALHR